MNSGSCSQMSSSWKWPITFFLFILNISNTSRLEWPSTIGTIPEMDSNGVSDKDLLEFQTKGIVSLLRNINTKKASGPDTISCFVLKEAAEEIAAFLQFIFN